MEDLNQIQEFFSKPLEEISTDSVAMKQQYLLTEPVQIAYTDSFGTGISKARGVLHQANAGYFIGEEDAYIIILPGGTFYVSEDEEVAMRIWPIRDQSNEFGAALAKTPFAPKYADWKDSLRKAPVKEADLNDPVLMKMRAAKDKLAKMRKANAGDDGNDKFFDNAKKIAFLKKEREQLMRDMEQEAEPEGGPIADEYGRKLNKIDAAIAKLSGRKEMDYDTAVGKVDEANVSWSTLHSSPPESDLIASDIQKAMNQNKGDEAIIHQLKIARRKMNVGDLKKAKEIVSRYLAVGLEELEKGYSPQLVSPENPKGETGGLTTDTMNKILMKVIQDLDELKQLGEGMIEEKLCKKGQAYRKKRMAAGEKSSAYLNGRAVKVCKGQMKG